MGGNFDALGGGESGRPKPVQPGGNTANNKPVSGTIPNRPAGKTNAVSKAVNPNAPKGTHRRFLWLANYNQASLNTGREVGYSIELTFTNKRQELLTQAFGAPDEVQNSKWVYRGLRVYDMRKRVALQTVVFNIVNRRIVSVVSY